MEEWKIVLIAVGGTAICILLIVLLFYCCRLLKTRKKQLSEKQTPVSEKSWITNEEEHGFMRYTSATSLHEDVGNQTSSAGSSKRKSSSLQATGESASSRSDNINDEFLQPSNTTRKIRGIYLDGLSPPLSRSSQLERKIQNEEMRYFFSHRMFCNNSIRMVVRGRDPQFENLDAVSAAGGVNPLGQGPMRWPPAPPPPDLIEE